MDALRHALADLDARRQALLLELEKVTTACVALRQLVDEPATPEPETPAPPPLPEVQRPVRADVRGRAPDPFAFNAACVVCGKNFRKNGPRQTVCSPCRKLDPRISIEALKALYAKRQEPAPGVPARTTVEDCVGPAQNGLEPCPLKKQVLRDPKARGPIRCPDCFLEVKRRNTTARLAEKRTLDKAVAARIDGVRAPASDEETVLETVWNGGEGLSSYAQRSQE
jgi:hypothetical protein